MSWMEIAFHPLIKTNNKKQQTPKQKNELHKTGFRRKSEEEIRLTI